MKKIPLTILFILILPVYAAAYSADDTLSIMENSLFGYDYADTSSISRLERIETHLYGSKKSGDIKERLKNIENDTGIVIEDKSKYQKRDIEQNTGLNPLPVQSAQKPDTSIKEDSSVEYPMVDRLEQTVFKQTYRQDNIYARLNRLEEKIFEKTSNADLNSRVDKLSSAIRPKMKQNPVRQMYNEDTGAYTSSGGFESVDNQSIQFKLSALEQDILNSNYNNDNISQRLGRLEEKLFNRTFSNDNDAMRLQRILAAYNAKKQSYMYDNNRKMQNMAAISQLGGILLMILAILL